MVRLKFPARFPVPSLPLKGEREVSGMGNNREPPKREVSGIFGIY